ncbi:hypothetical protein FRB90_008840 [Tulasnella sp. 427]|nr:hypothetical protein FRB90_008840 [Tulasnella sp. 427]
MLRPVLTLDNIVVDYHWVNACVDAGTLLGPPSWGGFYISPLTLDHFFNPSPADTTRRSPSLSQAPTLVSPLYAPQYLPNSTSDVQSASSSRKPSLPTIPPQILQKFRSSGPSVSPTQAHFSPSSITTSFRAVPHHRSTTGEESSSQDDDPAPIPPPESQKRYMNGNRYYYTDAEKEFMRDYAAWAERQGFIATSIAHQISSLAPHHSETKWFGHMSKYANQYAKRVPEKQARIFVNAESEDDELQPQSSDKDWNQEEESDVSEDAPSGGPSSKLPEPSKKTAKGPYGSVPAYTQEEIDGIAKLVMQNPNQPLAPLFEQFAETRVEAGLFPQRRGPTYAQYYRTHTETLRNRGRTLLASSQSRPSMRTKGAAANEVPVPDNNAIRDDENQDSTSSRPKRIRPHYTEEEIDVIAKVVAENSDKPLADRFLELSASRLALGLLPHRTVHAYNEFYRRKSDMLHERGRRLLGKTGQPPEDDAIPSTSAAKTQTPTLPADASNEVPNFFTRGYSEQDFLAVIDFVARHPEMFRNSDEGKLVVKERLWEKFDQEYPGRSPKAWREFFRKRADQIEQDAQALIEKRNSSAGAGSSKELDEMLTIAKSAQRTPNQLWLPPSSADAGKLSVPSVAQPSLGATKRALSTDDAVGSSVPASKKLKENSVG